MIIDEFGYPYLIDFGSCISINDSNKESINLGTIEYMSPERLLNNKYN